MAIREELRIEAIEEDTAIIMRTNYQRIEYPLSWIPFEVNVGDDVEGMVVSCADGIISRIDFINPTQP